ncbi:hypothetical protein V8E36_008604 [Tilletia maclaganii]
MLSCPAASAALAGTTRASLALVAARRDDVVTHSIAGDLDARLQHNKNGVAACTTANALRAHAPLERHGRVKLGVLGTLLPDEKTATRSIHSPTTYQQPGGHSPQHTLIAAPPEAHQHAPS